MKVILFLIFSSLSFSQDFGNGSDGVCNFTGGLQAKSVWNCTDLFVSGNTTFPTSSKVVLKVSGGVTVSAAGTLSVSASGTTPGGGGMSGGVCSATPCSSPQTDASNSSGVLAEGGDAGTDDNTLGASGGGGSGATYNPIDEGKDGATGTDGGSPSQGAGGVASLTGYGSEANFATTINGGSGGGAGGSSDEIGTLVAGGAGGGGGGIIQIFSKGSVDIDGEVLSRGGDGVGAPATNNGSVYSGGGGGGSGGAIFIYSQSTISVSGKVEALGGTGGVTGGAGSSGGNGGVGRIRMDSFDGTISGGVNVDPAPEIFTARALSGLKAKFKSDISHNCSFKEERVDFYPSFIFGMLLSLFFMGLLKRI